MTENSNHIFIKIDEAKGKALLETALKGIEQLRNNSFHFKGLDGFIKPLLDLKTSDNNTATALQELWKQDSDKQQQAIIAEMEAVECHEYFKQKYLKRIAVALEQQKSTALSLPRFNRLLTRNQHTGLQSTLPDMYNRTQMEAAPALRCQYKTLHMLYNRPFKNWLENCDAVTLNKYIKIAIERTTEQAQSINDKNNKNIYAKATYISEQSHKNIHEFLANLSAATASEMRVQNYYQSNSENARKQSKYLEDLKCYVIALP